MVGGSYRILETKEWMDGWNRATFSGSHLACEIHMQVKTSILRDSSHLMFLGAAYCYRTI